MNSVETLIQNAEMVTSIFGYWPSFHDAEVVDLTLQRLVVGDALPAMIATIHVFEMTGEVSSSGHFVCNKHSLVTLRFHDIDGLRIEYFNHQNALSCLSIVDISDCNAEKTNLEVAFEGAYGMDCDFTCRAIEVLSVVPGIPPQSVYLPASKAG